jgi:poly-gamma-glutamate capsule biosynthesis protein CapA/YwtB (metallophosphatase superfamily)
MKSARVAVVLSAVALSIMCGSGARAKDPDGSFTFTLGGQSMIRGDVRTSAPDAVPDITSLVKGEVAFTNFEATVLDTAKGETYQDGRFLSPPEAMGALKSLGFNLVALSDNHSFDLQVAGIENTLAQADRLALAHAGTGHDIKEAAAPGYLRTAKGTVALVAMASGLIPEGGAATASHAGVNELRVTDGRPNQEDADRILQSIHEAKKHAGFVIAYQHNHVYERPFVTIVTEELPERLRPPEWVKKWTHDEIRAGADIVVMHGAPLLHGIEIYEGRPIFYDLGNFFFQVPPAEYQLDEPINWESVVAYVQFDHATLRSITLQPIALNKIGQGQPEVHDPHAHNEYLQTRGLPKAVHGEQAYYILQRLADLSLPFGTQLDVKGDVAQVKLDTGH